MRPTINFGFAALVLGAAFASVPAFAQQNAPLSPGGISAAADSFGGPGPGYIAPETPGKALFAYAPAGLTAYSNTGPRGAPLSPGGIGTGADSFGGPGYVGP